MNCLNILLNSFLVIHLHLKQFCLGNFFDWYSSYSFADDFMISFVVVKYLQTKKKICVTNAIYKNWLEKYKCKFKGLFVVNSFINDLSLAEFNPDVDFISFYLVWFMMTFLWTVDLKCHSVSFYLFLFMKVNRKKTFHFHFSYLNLLFRNRAR